MSSAYFDRNDDNRKQSFLDKSRASLFAAAWISIVGSVTYGTLMFTGLLPEEMRLAALDQMLNPEVDEEDPEEVVESAGIDPKSLAMLAMAGKTLGDTEVGLAATDLLEEYDEEAFALMQQMELKGGGQDYLAMVTQLPDDLIDTEMSREEALAELASHSEAMAEMQALMNEQGFYDGPNNGLDETGDITDIEESLGHIAETATAMTENGEEPTPGSLVEALEQSSLLAVADNQVREMTDQAVQSVLDNQRFTVPMLDVDTTNIKKIKAYRSLMEDPDTMLSGETDSSVQFIKSYMLPHTLLTDAIQFREAGQTERALNALRLIFMAFPEHAMTGDALLLLSDIQDSQGESEASRRTLNTFLTVHGGHPRVVDGVVRYSDWHIASGEGLPAACRWLAHVSVYPPAVHERGLKSLQQAARLRDCYGTQSRPTASLRRTGS